MCCRNLFVCNQQQKHKAMPGLTKKYHDRKKYGKKTKKSQVNNIRKCPASVETEEITRNLPQRQCRGNSEGSDGDIPPCDIKMELFPITACAHRFLASSECRCCKRGAHAEAPLQLGCAKPCVPSMSASRTGNCRSVARGGNAEALYDMGPRPKGGALWLKQ